MPGHPVMEQHVFYPRLLTAIATKGGGGSPFVASSGIACFAQGHIDIRLLKTSVWEYVSSDVGLGHRMLFEDEDDSC